MWINQKTFDQITERAFNNVEQLAKLNVANEGFALKVAELTIQLAKNEMTADWMRHRINALEKERAVLMRSTTQLSFPVPEIEALAPHARTSVFSNVKTDNNMPGFDALPSFEDVGEELAAKMGITHKDDGTLEYRD